MADKLPDLNRLKSQLLTSGVSQQNNALFQVINQLINYLAMTQQILSAQISGISPPSPSPPAVPTNILQMGNPFLEQISEAEVALIGQPQLTSPAPSSGIIGSPGGLMPVEREPDIEVPLPLPFLNFPNLFYAEGSWTPTITFGGGSTGITYDSNLGRWLRIGRFVYLVGFIDMSAKGSSTGNAAVAGMPFSIATVALTGASYFFSMVAGIDSIFLVQSAGNSTMLVQKNDAAGSTIQCTDADFTNNTRLGVGIGYFTDQH